MSAPPSDWIMHRNLLNLSYPITEGNVANDKNAVEAKQEHWTKWMWNAIATYNLEIGKHRGDAMVGMG